MQLTISCAVIEKLWITLDDFGGIDKIGLLVVDKLVEWPIVIALEKDFVAIALKDFVLEAEALDVIGLNEVVGKYPKLPA